MDKKQLDYQREYYQKNRERRLAENKEYHEQNKEKRNEYARQYYRDHKEIWDNYRREHADERNARRRERYANDPKERQRKIDEVKQYRLRHPEARLKRTLSRYGLTIEEYAVLSASGCAICGREVGEDDLKRLHIDHCHATGQFRGILCESCNLGLGKFQDDPEVLERAAMYLRTHIRDKEDDN